MKNDNDESSGPDFFPMLKKGGTAFPSEIKSPSSTSEPVGGNMDLRDALWTGHSQEWRATGYNSPSTKVMDVKSNESASSNPLFCFATGCKNVGAEVGQNKCSNSDCSTGTALMTYGPHSAGSTITFYVHGNLYCNCWEAVGVGGGKSVDGGCKYRIMGDFTAANCGAQAAYTDYTAFWIRSLPPPDDTFMSCRDALEQGHTETGNYDIYMDGAVYSMYCDFDTSDGPCAP